MVKDQVEHLACSTIWLKYRAGETILSTIWLKKNLPRFILLKEEDLPHTRKKIAASPISIEPKNRRSQIVRAAYCAIAEMGFEGLRMREIAARAGIDHSTLHYYFRSKESLIAGVMDYMVQELSLGRDTEMSDRQRSPREQLDAHFASLLRQAREHPEMFVVLAEIHARSARDSGIHSVMQSNERAWKKFIVGILRAGVRTGDFDPMLDTDIAADAVLALIRGLNLGYSLNLTRAERALGQLVKWLAGSPGALPRRPL